MKTGKVHLIVAHFDKHVKTACGRDGYFEDDGFLVQNIVRGIQNFPCAQYEITCQMSASYQRSRVNCSVCVKRMKDEQSQRNL